MDHAEFIAVQCKTMIDTLESLRDGRLGVIETARAIASIRTTLDDPDNPIFVPFIAVDSETDTIPVGDVRARCSREALVRFDAERETAEKLYRDHLIEASEPLLSYAKSHAL